MEFTNNNEERTSYIEGDILISILSKLSLLDLISACQVSKSWNRAVFFSLLNYKTFPWLFIYKQRSFQPYNTSAIAYDPKSDNWIELKTTSLIQHVSPTLSSHSSLLYTQSHSQFSFSLDAFHLSWRHVVGGPMQWIDPIVAVVGKSLIVAGGDERYVELMDIESDSDTWMPCESIPHFLSSSATFVSVAVSSEKMYVTEKKSGEACCFDPVTRTWTELLDLCHVDCKVYSRVIGFVNDRLIMAGINGDEDNPLGIKFWEVVTYETRMNMNFDLIGYMPRACFDKLRVVDYEWPLTSIEMNVVGDMVYIHNAAKVGDIVAAEMEGGKLGKWRTLGNVDAIWDKSCVGEKIVVACSDVCFSDLKGAVKNNLSFAVVSE